MVKYFTNVWALFILVGLRVSLERFTIRSHLPFLLLPQFLLFRLELSLTFDLPPWRIVLEFE